MAKLLDVSKFLLKEIHDQPCLSMQFYTVNNEFFFKKNFKTSNNIYDVNQSNLTHGNFIFEF